MPKFKITDSQTGKAVTVSGDSAPTDQEAEQIFKDAGLRAGKSAPSSFVDAARALPGGLAKGVTGLLGLPGDMFNPARTETVEGLGGEPVSVDKGQRQALPTSSQLNDVVSAPFGGYYKPQTSAGRYAETAASFAPAVIGGGASLPARIMGRALAPAAGARLAGSLASEEDHPVIHGLLETGGAVLGGGLAGGTRALGRALLEKPSSEVTANNYLAKILSGQEIGPEALKTNAVPNRGQMAAEALGQGGIGALATLGRRPGATGEALADALTARSVAAPSRIMDDYASAAGIHPEAAKGNIDALVASGRAKAKPYYDQAINTPSGVMTPILAELTKRPVIKKAFAQAAEDIRNDGGDPHRYGLFFDEAGNATQVSHPTAEAWDLVKKAVGKSVERDAFGKRLPDSVSPGNARISNANRELSGAMSDAIPGYGDALKESGDYLSLQSAFEAGQRHILNTKTTAADVQKHVQNLSAAEIDAYKGGIANEVFQKAQNARLAPRLLNTPAVQQKLSAALGPDKAQQFISGIQQEMALAKSGGRMMPGTNSITSDVLLNSAEQDQGANLSAALHAGAAAGHLLSGNPMGAVTKGISAIRHFAPDLLKTGGMSQEARDEAGRLLMLSPEALASHLSNPALIPPKKTSLLGQLLMKE